MPHFSNIKVFFLLFSFFILLFFFKFNYNFQNLWLKDNLSRLW